MKVQLFVVAGTGEREQRPTMRRHRQIRGEHNEIVHIRQWPLEAFGVAAIAQHRHALAATVTTENKQHMNIIKQTTTNSYQWEI